MHASESQISGNIKKTVHNKATEKKCNEHEKNGVSRLGDCNVDLN